MNYGQLKVYLASYVSRTDLTDTNFDIWQQNANQRLLRDSRIVQLDRSETISNPAGDIIYPVSLGDFLFMDDLQSVTITGNNPNPIALIKVSWEQFAEAQAIGVANGVTTPWCYCMFSTGFKVAPGNQADFVFEVVFRAADRAMSADTETNNYLSWAQPVYIEAMLIEIYKFLRDVEGEQLATARYDRESQAYFNYYRWQHSGANQGPNSGAWSWV
jgi:hypothetical protein